MVNKISEKEFESVKEKNVAILDFSATWCTPCKMLEPVLEEVSEVMSGDVDFYNIDVDVNPDLAQEFGVANIPALIMLKNGKKVAMQVGFQPKEVIIDFINGNK